MQKINEQIYDQAGIVASDNFGVVDEMLDDIATQAYRVIVNRVQTYNPDKLSFFSYETALADGSGKEYSDLKSNIILGCERIRGDFRYPCVYMPWQFAEKAKNPNTINYRTKYDPIYTEKNGKVYIIPDPSSSESGYIHHIKFADIITNAVETINATSDMTFPIELDPALIKYCVMMVKLRIMNRLMTLAQNEWANVTGVTTLASQAFTSQTSFTFTHNVGSIPGIVILDTNGKEIGGELDHAADFNSVDVVFIFPQSGTIYALKSTASGGDLAAFVAALPTWASPTVPSMPSVPTTGDLAALTNAIPTYADIDFSGITPPTALASTFGTVPTIVAIADLQTTTIADIDTVRIQNALDQAADFLYKYWDEDKGGGAGQEDTITVDAHSKITSHDVALSNEAIKAANAFTQNGAQEIATEVAKLSNIETELKHVIADFNGKIQGYGLRYNGVISEYVANIQRYVAAIRAVVDKYAQESISDVAKFTAEFQYLVAKFNAEIQSDVAVYRAIIEGILGEYSALVNEMAQEFAAGMSKARSYLESARIRLDTGKAYTEQMGLLPNEIALLGAQFENEIRLFCGVQPTQNEDRS